MSARCGDDKATSPSIPAVRRPALRWVTCRTLISVFDHDPSINFCSDRTVAQSCSRVALKILRRNLITFCSWARQSTAIPLDSDVLGSVHRDGVQLAPSVHQAIGLGVQRLTCPRQHPFESGRSDRHPAGSPRRPPGAAATLSRVPSPFGHRHPLLGHPVPPRDSAPLTIGLPGPRKALDPTGFPRSTHTRYGRGGCPLYPEASGVPTTGSHCRSPLAAPSSGQALSPRCSSRLPGLEITRHHQGVHSRSPVRPSPRPVAPPDGTGALRLLPWASHPNGQDPSTHARAGIDLEH